MQRGRRRAASLLAALWMGVGAMGQAQTPRDRAPGPAAPAGTAVVSGRMTVTTPSGSQPVRRATVTLESAVLRAPLIAATDTDGRFQFSGLAAGRYRVKGEKPGFVAAVADPRRAFEPSPEFDVTTNGRSVQDLPMQPAGAIEGRILSDSGDPAVNMVVSAVRLGYDATGRKVAAVRQVRTDDRGRYRVHTLPPGEYLVDAAPDPLAAMSTGPTPTVLARNYFPGTARLEEARAVPIVVGQNVTDIDFALTRVPVISIRGLVLNAAGQPAKGASVRMQRVGGPVGEVRGGGPAGDNTFVYPTVPPGEYWMLASWRSAPNAEPEFAALRVSVAGEAMPNITLTTARVPALTGRIDGASIPVGAQVVALETSYEWPAPQMDRAFAWTAPIAADGTFTFPSLPGPRVLRLTGAENLPPIMRVRVGDADVTDAPFELNAEAPATAHIEVAAGASISGVVTLDRRPAARAWSPSARRRPHGGRARVRCAPRKPTRRVATICAGCRRARTSSRHWNFSK